MSQVKKLSSKMVKRNFTTIGLMLIIYVLFVLIIPHFLHIYLEDNTSLLKDETIFYGLNYLIIVFGTLIPFFMMRKFAGIKTKHLIRKVNASFIDLFVQAIVFFNICFALTYISNIIINRFGIDGKLISGIGISENIDLNNIIYIFMFIGLSPLLEEYAFRGVLLNALARYNKKFALIASSLIFALAHSNFGEILPAFAMGIALGKMSLRYKSIQPTIVVHILFNAFIYSLYMLPSNIASYMGYGLAAICILAIYLYLSGRYQRIGIQKSVNKTIPRIFFTRFTVIFSMILMVAYTCLLTFIK